LVSAPANGVPSTSETVPVKPVIVAAVTLPSYDRASTSVFVVVLMSATPSIPPFWIQSPV